MRRHLNHYFNSTPPPSSSSYSPAHSPQSPPAPPPTSQSAPGTATRSHNPSPIHDKTSHSPNPRHAPRKYPLSASAASPARVPSPTASTIPLLLYPATGMGPS